MTNQECFIAVEVNSMRVEGMGPTEQFALKFASKFGKPHEKFVSIPVTSDLYILAWIKIGSVIDFEVNEGIGDLVQ